MTNHYYTGQVLDEGQHEAAIAAIVDTGATVYVEPNHGGTRGRTRFACSANMGTVYTYWYHEYQPQRISRSWPREQTRINRQEYLEMMQYSIELGLSVAIEKAACGSDDSVTLHRYTVYSREGTRCLWLAYRPVGRKEKADKSVNRRKKCTTPPFYMGHTLKVGEHEAAIAALVDMGATVHVSSDPFKPGSSRIMCEAVANGKHSFWYTKYDRTSPERWPGPDSSLVTYGGHRSAIRQAIERGSSASISKQSSTGYEKDMIYVYYFYEPVWRPLGQRRRPASTETGEGPSLPLVPYWDC